MANYATNLFFASTENQNDLERIGQFLDENLCDSMYEMYDECIDGEFCSRWKYPEEAIDDMINQLEDKNSVYIRILTFELSDEYVSFRVFTNGDWEIRLETLPCVISRAETV